MLRPIASREEGRRIVFDFTVKEMFQAVVATVFIWVVLVLVFTAGTGVAR
jgi:hypothetical protein